MNTLAIKGPCITCGGNMRKVFIDGGANRGQSTYAFLEQWPEAKEYEIFMFEPNTGQPVVRGDKTTLIRKALWTHDGSITFYEKNSWSEGNTLIKEKTSREKREYFEKSIECISLSNWIKDNFSEEDYIILKIDIEGAEYEVMKDMHTEDVFKYVDMFFCEIHGLKCGKSFEESIELLEICKQNDITPYVWNGNTFKYSEYKDRKYTKQFLEKEFDKWKKRGLK